MKPKSHHHRRVRTRLYSILDVAAGLAVVASVGLFVSGVTAAAIADQTGSKTAEATAEHLIIPSTGVGAGSLLYLAARADQRQQKKSERTL